MFQINVKGGALKFFVISFNVKDKGFNFYFEFSLMLKGEDLVFNIF